jgi:hypothetical protein
LDRIIYLSANTAMRTSWLSPYPCIVVRWIQSGDALNESLA